MPTLILGADAHALWDTVEAALLTTLAVVVACPIAVRTRHLASRVSYLEGLPGRVLAGRTWRSGVGALREEYDLELEGGLHVVMDGSHLRFVPLCDGRPMRFDGARKGAILPYRCPDCGRTTELLR